MVRIKKGMIRAHLVFQMPQLFLTLQTLLTYLCTPRAIQNSANYFVFFSYMLLIRYIMSTKCNPYTNTISTTYYKKVDINNQ